MATAISATPGVAGVGQPLVNVAGDTAQIPAFLTTSPQSAPTSETLHELRDEVVPAALDGSAAKGMRSGRLRP